MEQADRLKPFVGNVIAELKKFQVDNKIVLFEGAQGALLDYSLGTYPFVTSSNSSLGGIASGAGVSAKNIDYSDYI